ncbi:MAG: TonB-dependent receptor [Thermoanaerobaculia bacterium]
MRLISRICLVLLITVVATAAWAGETGSISGVVKDGSGLAVPGAVVKVFGPQMPAGYTTVSRASGSYSFPKLLPGAYTVEAELKGLGKAAKKVTVSVDTDYQINLALVQTAAAEVVVTGVNAEVDKKATEVNSNFVSAEISQLPIARNYSGLINLIPGAPGSRDTAGAVSIAGGTREDNKYLIDGVNITNPGYGNLSVDTNELDIVDVNVKRAAITAEFGRTSGVIVNAVTKSGTNEIKGTVRFVTSPASFAANNNQGIVTQETDTWNATAGVGFPILKDTLFGYVSGRYAKTTTSGLSATLGGVTTTQPDGTSKSTDYFGKVTALLGQSLLMNASFRGLPNKSDNQFNSVYDVATAAYGSDNTNTVANVTADWIATKDTILEAKYVHLTEDDTSTAQIILNDRPLTIDPNNLGKYGAYSDPTRNGGNVGYDPYKTDGYTYRRDEAKLTANFFLEAAGTQNQIKIGGGAEFIDLNFLRPTNGWGNLIYSSTTEVRARYYTNTPQQVGRGRTYSFFLQDNLTSGPFSATLGVLLNREDFAQLCVAGTICGPTAAVNTATTRYNFLGFSWGDEAQPRIGLAYNANLFDGDKFYGSFGIYSGIDAKSALRSQAPFRIREDQSFFSRTTGQFLREQIRGSSAGHQIPQGLTAPSYQEWVAGYAAPVGHEFSFDVYYQYKTLRNPLEDTPIDPANYFGSFVLHNFPNAKRVYTGATIDITKRYSHGWYLNANYTYSRLYGNFDDDFATLLFNNSSSLEDEPGRYTDDPASNLSGLLGQDRPHIFKVLGSYDLPFGFTLGGFLRIQSGTPWEAHGYTASQYARYLEPAGSRRLPTWTNFDLLGAYTFKFGGDMSVRVEGRVQNLFNTQTVLSVNQLQYTDPYVDPPTGSAANLGPQQTKQPNALFGTPTSWAAPRRFTLTALFNF